MSPVHLRLCRGCLEDARHGVALEVEAAAPIVAVRVYDHEHLLQLLEDRRELLVAVHVLQRVELHLGSRQHDFLARQWSENRPYMTMYTRPILRKALPAASPTASESGSRTF